LTKKHEFQNISEIYRRFTCKRLVNKKSNGTTRSLSHRCYYISKGMIYKGRARNCKLWLCC